MNKAQFLGKVLDHVEASTGTRPTAQLGKAFLEAFLASIRENAEEGITFAGFGSFGVRTTSGVARKVFDKGLVTPPRRRCLIFRQSRVWRDGDIVEEGKVTG